ncbi:Delta2-dienoyl-CoA-isomerase [Macrolepiota fuliginosa MF-IS2]|uniref:Delta2-dienoyl-CoA-isomerase n=1 Tax=Macrolepiota fuliginosa MF-IS2 TaxID=1400762 RepID=A0A9P6C1S5_9AGAR|nr:Delta2-dienoyl-CoA-isomerase [Macrolepiota fuliginosa MF-IS2]
MSKYSSKWLHVSEPSPHVLLVQLARPPVNAFNTEYWKAYGKLFNDLTEDGYDVRALVLASDLPKIFTAGLDLKNAGTLAHYDQLQDPARTSLTLHTLIKTFQQNITSPERAPFPVIAAVHGLAIGLAIDMIASCDIRYATSSASFAIKEVDVGLAADIGTLALLPKITGNLSLVRELAYTGRMFSAEEALNLGLVSKVVEGDKDEVLHAALDLAKVIATKSPVAVSGTKRLITHARDHSVMENLVYTQSWNAHALLTEDMKECVKAIKEKREPKFAKLRVASKL